MASGWYLVVAGLATMAAWARGNFDAVVTMGCVGDGLDSELLLLRHHWTYAPSSPLQPPAVVVMGFSSLPNTTTCQIDTRYGLQSKRDQTREI
ncbi:hypothetical protein DAI22_02g004000 [Oryza sativa Japonica Group]|nr:hypothetical protein DAI22_02g004000 [Oryza sativa Japonica Group]